MPDPLSADVDAARRAVERFCGWHVTPAAEKTVTLDGPGSPLLVLPTLNVIEISSVTENGVELDLDTLAWSKTGLVRKKDRLWWSAEYGAIEVTFTHGFDDAEDFEKAVDQVARSIMAGALRDSTDMIEKQVDDVRYKWSDRDTGLVAGFLLDGFRLEKQA